MALGNQWIEGVPAGHDGQTLADLTMSIYRYHNDLRRPRGLVPVVGLALRPQARLVLPGSFAGPTTGLIHDTGNLVVFWLGIPAMAFLGWAAWRRRSMSLAIVVVLWLSLWLPGSHRSRDLPVPRLREPAVPRHRARLPARGAVARPGPRTWFLARLSAAVAVLGIPLLWLARQLCRLAGSETAHPNGVSCGEIERTAAISPAAPSLSSSPSGLRSLYGWHGGAAGLAAAATRRVPPSQRSARRCRCRSWWRRSRRSAVWSATILLDREGTFSLSVSPEILALLGLVVLAPIAWLVMRARDARRLVLGILAAATVWFVVWYPNIAGLPLPSDIAHVYQGVLPTWNWDFQFAVNLDPPASGPLIDVTTLVIALVALGCAVGGSDRSLVAAAGARRADRHPARCTRASARRRTRQRGAGRPGALTDPGWSIRSRPVLELASGPSSPEGWIGTTAGWLVQRPGVTGSGSAPPGSVPRSRAGDCRMLRGAARRTRSSPRPSR